MTVVVYGSSTIKDNSLFKGQHTHNPQFLDSLQRRANARNVSSLRQPIHVISAVDKTKLNTSPALKFTVTCCSRFPVLFLCVPIDEFINTSY